MVGANDMEQAQAPHWRSDAQRRFRAYGVAAGGISVTARGCGVGQWRGVVEVFAGRTSEVEARLGAGATLRGRVTTSEGEPVAGAGIGVGPSGVLGVSI